MQSTITVDIGTTSVKLCLFEADASLAASARRATPTVSDADGEVYDVPALEALVEDFVRGLAPDTRREVRRIAIAGVGESGGLVRADGSLASPMILWHDHRGAGSLASLTAEDHERIFRVTGLPVNGNYGISKTAWALERALGTDDTVWLNVAEYLAARLSEDRWSEPSLASRTMALDVRSGTWSAEVCGMFGISPEAFPPLRAASEGASIREGAAAALGLDPKVRVHVAGHDHMVGAVGADLRPGELLNSTGTTEGLLVLAPEPRLDETARSAKLANGIDCTGKQRTLFASIPTGGSTFATLQHMLDMDGERLASLIDTLHTRWIADEIDLERVPVVLPRFRGSPPPTKDRAARGLIAGLRDDTTAEDIVLGAFLGLARQFADVLDLFDAVPCVVKVIGPASGNPLWLQIKADLLGAPLSVSRFPEVVSRGAQALACAETTSWQEVDPFEVRPDSARHARLGAWAEDTGPLWRHLQGAPS
ncbi:FGGY-family carbohydrate kinase [Brachybacterium kimchii]|uniref:FGGY family carbohydrate kinase n=1 Tax=Brachybacterium kimchii TaxID=2942909 RepID=A0ABY4N4E6_9MICO|nr:FGGY family carbohydrate kinase [Brachybacterium kimchii]UQN28996.1 FGGY family carbohydrate kinase [Brachybacterium kimchii]